MKTRITHALVIFSLFVATSVMADMTLKIPDGRVVLLKDNGTWEFVTDSSNQSSSAGGYQTIDIDDLRVDFEMLKGKKVKVTAMANYFADTLMISRGDDDMSTVTVDMKNVSREQRKYVIQNFSEAKKLTVYGTVGVVDFVDCLIADKIEW